MSSRLKIWTQGALSLLSAFMLAHPGGVWAESVGSPSSILKKGKWSFGVGGGALAGRDVGTDVTAAVYQVGHFRGYGLTDWLSIYGKIGVAYLQVDDPSIKKKDGSTEHRFDANVLSSVQLKGKLFENRKRDFEWDGSLQYVDIRGRHRDKNTARWHEWQFATSLAKGFGRLKPYLGVKYSMTSLPYKVKQDGVLLGQGRYHMAAAGPFLGTDYSFGRYEDVVLIIETSYLSGAEVDVALSYSF